MGDKATLAKARQELEEFYLGIPDDSMDLSFQDLAGFQKNELGEERRNNMEPIREETEENRKQTAGLSNSPSLDFSKALQASHGQHRLVEEEIPSRNSGGNSLRRDKGLRVVIENNNHSQVRDEVRIFSMATPVEEKERRRRPGIPHTNICALCSVYAYFFRYRCLVCGRLYCRQCVGMGMGDMSEGRKCIECLGRRFSQRYIHKAGQPGCCCWRYPSAVRQQELMWAEKGPRRRDEKRYGTSAVVSTLRSTLTPGSPSRSYVSRAQSSVILGTPTRSHASNGPASFVMSSALSPGPHSPHAFPL